MPPLATAAAAAAEGTYPGGECGLPLAAPPLVLPPPGAAAAQLNPPPLSSCMRSKCRFWSSAIWN